MPTGARSIIRFQADRNAVQDGETKQGLRTIGRCATLVAIVLLWSGSWSLCLAKDEVPAQPAATSSERTQRAPEVHFSDGLLSVVARDVDIRSLMETIALKSGVEIVLDKTITGKTTVDFADVEFEEGLKNVLKDVVEGGFASEYARKNNEKGQLALTKVTIARVGIQGQSSGENAPKVETYSPEILAEGGWGEGPGEFGVAWTLPNSLANEEPSGRIEPFYPTSIAVNSRGEVYILDPVNNRIQKFSNAGTYLRSLPVEAYAGAEARIWYGQRTWPDGTTNFDKVFEKREGRIGVDRWFPFYDPMTTQGINIVIDAQDTLYYYRRKHETKLKEGNPLRYSDPKQPQPYGEVQILRDDVLVKTVRVPVVDTIYGLSTDWAGNIWVGVGDYELREGRQKERNRQVFGLRDGRSVEIYRPQNGNAAVVVQGAFGRNEKETVFTKKHDEITWEAWVASTYFVTRKNEVFVYHGWYGENVPKREAYLDRYSEGFELLSSAKLPLDPKYPDREVDLLRSVLDEEGNIYSLSVTDQGVKAIKWRRSS